MQTYLIIAGAAVVCGILIVLIRSPGAFKRFVGCAAAGFAALAAVDLTSAFTGVFIAVSGWSLAVAGLLGLPGVVSMLVVKMLWKV